MSVILLAILFSGCVSISAELQPPDEAVKPLLKGSDCVQIIFGFGFGTVRVREAMRTYTYTPTGFATISSSTATEGRSIRKIHSVMLTDEAGFGFGSRCLEVTGEP